MFPGLEDESPNEINTRLDSLCLSVAEHALAGKYAAIVNKIL